MTRNKLKIHACSIIGNACLQIIPDRKVTFKRNFMKSYVPQHYIPLVCKHDWWNHQRINNVKASMENKKQRAGQHLFMHQTLYSVTYPLIWLQ